MADGFIHQRNVSESISFSMESFVNEYCSNATISYQNESNKRKLSRQFAHEPLNNSETENFSG